LEGDRETIKWQGTVTAEVAPGLFLLQLFEWIAGTETNQVVVPVADMTYWRIYDSAEEMNEAYRKYNAKRKHRAAP
jgi:predicted Rossmann-fold nucleotide-binding protein